MDFIYSHISTFLIFLILFLLIIVLFIRFFYKQKKWNEQYVGLASGRFFYVKYIFLCISFFILLGTLFAPSDVEIGNKNKQIGNDVVFVLDVSKSMNVEDIESGGVNISRLEAAKKMITYTVNTYQNNRYGLVIFAGDAISSIPLTSDYDNFLTFLQGVDYHNVLQQGSNFEKAVLFGTQRFSISDKKYDPIFLLLSDGGDEGDNININQSKEMLKKYMIQSKVIGVGTSKGGKIILGYDVFGNPIYQKFHGQDIISTLNTKNLKNISQNMKATLSLLEKENDISKINLNFRESSPKSNWEYGGDIREKLVLLSFIIFVCFFLFYCFEQNLYKLIKKYV